MVDLKSNFFLIILLIIPISYSIKLDDKNMNIIQQNNLNVLFEENNLDVNVIIEFKDDAIIEYKRNIENSTNSLNEQIYEKVFGKEKVITYKLNNYKNKMILSHNTLLNQLNGKTKKDYTYIMNGMATTIKQKDFEKVKSMNTVKNIWVDGIVTAQLDESVPLINADKVWSKQNASGYNITGAGIIVALIDSGIAYNHSDLGNCTTTEFISGTCSRIVYGYDFVNDDNDPYDDNGHGTHCAGIIGANGIMKGVAPNVTFLAYKVLDSTNSGSFSDVISAIENATLYGANIISLSIGGTGYSDSAFQIPLLNAINNGILVVIAAGNEGNLYYTITSPGSDLNAFTVGGSTKLDGLYWYSSKGFVFYSNGSLAGIKPDILAPGQAIYSTVPIGDCVHCSITGYTTMSGTSMATPHVTGVAALLKQAHPDWNVNQLKSAITNPAIDLGFDANTQGSGRVDVLKSYELTTHIYPTNLFMEMFDSINISGRLFNITNFADNSITYSLTLDFNETGISAVLSNYSISLNSNISALINLSIQINKSLVTTSEYYGNIIINSSNQQNLSIPFAFFVLNNPEGCYIDDKYINEDIILNNKNCDIPDFNGNGVFIINRSNIILDCNYTQIIGKTQGVGIYVFQKKNITIRNCLVENYKWGILSYYANHTIIINNNISRTSNAIQSQSAINDIIIGNTIIFNESGGSGITQVFVINSTVFNNTITSHSIDGYSVWAIYLWAVENSNVSNNNMNLNDSNPGYSRGILLYDRSNNNHVDYNTINMYSERESALFFGKNSTNNTFSNFIVNTSTIPIMIKGENINFEIKDSIFNSDNSVEIGNDNNPGYLIKEGNWNFSNVTKYGQTPLNFTWYNGVNGTLNIFWNLNVIIKDNSGNRYNGINVSIYDVDDNLLYQNTTNVIGSLDKILLAYSNFNNTFIKYYTPHLVNFTYDNLSYFKTITLDTNSQLNFLFLFNLQKITVMKNSKFIIKKEGKVKIL